MQSLKRLQSKVGEKAFSRQKEEKKKSRLGIAHDDYAYSSNLTMQFVLQTLLMFSPSCDSNGCIIQITCWFVFSVVFLLKVANSAATEDSLIKVQ